MYFKIHFEPGFFTRFLLSPIFLKRVEIGLEKVKMFFQFTKSRAISILQTMQIISRTAHPGVLPTMLRAGTIASCWPDISRDCSSPLHSGSLALTFIALRSQTLPCFSGELSC